MATKLEQATERAAAIEHLRGILEPGTTVYTFVRHVARSGMSRTVSTLIVQDGEIREISYHVARALGWHNDHRRGGIVVQGAGMDMGFHTVYSLSQTLFGTHEGYALAQRQL